MLRNGYAGTAEGGCATQDVSHKDVSHKKGGLAAAPVWSFKLLIHGQVEGGGVSRCPIRA